MCYFSTSEVVFKVRKRDAEPAERPTCCWEDREPKSDKQGGDGAQKHPARIHLIQVDQI